MSETYNNLSDFLRNQMRMSHIYQPVMLIHLLENGGEATATEIAKSILIHDPTQIEYYQEITKRMPGRVLTNNRGVTTKVGNSYIIREFDQMSECEISELVAICEERLSSFLEAKEISPWRNRQLSSGYLSGSKKYQVLKNAKFRCLLCGISASEAPLTVDHIVPRKLGGSDDLSNLQALCHQCNSRKQATDDVDFRGVADSYHVREKGCPFCELPGTERLSVNELCYSTHAKPPVTEGHTLIVPKRHVTDYFDLYQPELNTIQQMLLKQKAIQEEQDKSITAFNVVIESGEDAGQSIPHCHVHLVPRRKGDNLSLGLGAKS